MAVHLVRYLAQMMAVHLMAVHLVLGSDDVFVAALLRASPRSSAAVSFMSAAVSFMQCHSFGIPLRLATCTETQLSAGGEGQRGQHALTSSTPDLVHSCSFHRARSDVALRC